MGCTNEVLTGGRNFMYHQSLYEKSCSNLQTSIYGEYGKGKSEKAFTGEEKCRAIEIERDKQRIEDKAKKKKKKSQNKKKKKHNIPTHQFLYTEMKIRRHQQKEAKTTP